MAVARDDWVVHTRHGDRALELLLPRGRQSLYERKAVAIRNRHKVALLEPRRCASLTFGIDTALQGYLAHKKTPSHRDPMVGLSLEPYAGPRGVVFLCARYPCSVKRLRHRVPGKRARCRAAPAPANHISELFWEQSEKFAFGSSGVWAGSISSDRLYYQSVLECQLPHKSGK